MAGLNSAVAEEDVITPRATLTEIVERCEHILANRLARRFSTKDAVKDIERRARALLAKEDGHEFDAEFGKIAITAVAVFDQVIEQAGAGHA